MKQMIRSFLSRTPGAWALPLLLLLSSRAQAQVVNDDCSGAVSLVTSAVCTAPVNGTVAGATQSQAPTTACGFGLTTATDVWYSFTATATTHLVTLAPRFAAILDVRDGACGSSTSVFCTTIANSNTAAVPVGGLVSGQTYFIRVYPATNTPPAGISSTFALCIGQGTAGPANDDCAGAITVPVNTSGTCTATASADNTLATASAGAPVPNCANYQGRDLWFAVTVPASGNLTVQTVVPTTGVDVGDTGMSIYSGTCGNLVEIGCDDDAAGNLKSLLSFSGRPAGQVLYIRVWAYGNSGSGTIAVCATSPAPAANDNCATAAALPVNTTCTPTAGTVNGATQSLPALFTCGFANVANDVWYSFTATGATQTLIFTGNFQAVLDVRSGTCASSASVFCGVTFTNQPLTLTGLTSGQSYFLRLYANGNGPPFNAAFTICLTPGPTPPSNDNCATSTALPVTTGCTSPTAGTVQAATQSLPPSVNCGFVNVANDVWYSFTATGPTQALSFTGNFQAVVDVRSGTCASSTSVFCSTTSTGLPFTVSGLTSGQSYFLRLYANNNAVPFNGAFSLCLTPGPTPSLNDDCAFSIYIPVTTGCASPTACTVQFATQSLPPSVNCGFVNVANDVWYSFTATGPTQTVTFTGNFQAVVDVRSGTCASSSSVFCSTAFAGQLLIIPGLTTGQDYLLRVYVNNVLPFNATFTLCISSGPTPPPNDDPCGAITLPLTAAGSPLQSLTSTTAGATTTVQPGIAAPCSPATAPQDVWFALTPAAGVTSIRLTISGSAAGMVRLFTAPNCATGPFTLISCRSSGANNTAVGSVTFTGLTAGQRYYLAVSGYGPADTPGAFTLAGAVVSASRVQAETTALLVFPNPSNTGQVTLRLSGSRASSQATLLNALGQVVLTKTLLLGNSDQVLPTRGLATGIYTLRVVVGNEVLTRKVVLE